MKRVFLVPVLAIGIASAADLGPPPQPVYLNNAKVRATWEWAETAYEEIQAKAARIKELESQLAQQGESPADPAAPKPSAYGAVTPWIGIGPGWMRGYIDVIWPENSPYWPPVQGSRWSLETYQIDGSWTLLWKELPKAEPPTDVQATTMRATWTDESDNELGFRLYWSRSGDVGTWTSIAEVVADVTEVEFPRPTESGWVVVAAYNEAGEGWSDKVYVEIPSSMHEPPATTILIEAENFVASYDTDDGGPGIPPAADVIANPGFSGGKAIGYTRVGEWMEYNLSISEPGQYVITILAANASTGGEFSASIDGVVVATFAVPGEGWSVFRDVSQSAYLEAGEHTLRIAATKAASGWTGDLDKITIKPQ